MHAPIRRAFEPLLLLLGDLTAFVGALFATLFVRYGEMPSEELFFLHVIPFAFLFALSVAIYFIAGLYDKQLLVAQQNLPQTIFRAQIVTVVCGALFFFLVPLFGIAPKTNLFIYLVLSWLAVLLWRLIIFPNVTTPRYERAIIVGEGREVAELTEELNHNPRSRIRVARTVALSALLVPEEQEQLLDEIRNGTITVCIIDADAEQFKTLLPFFYRLLVLGLSVRTMSLWHMYERVFDRVPPSALKHGWFMRLFEKPRAGLYTILKRAFDLFGALVLGLILLVLIPPIALAMRLEGKGPVFIKQTRIGRFNAPMIAYKFRTMAKNEEASDRWIGEGENRITSVGAILRRFSIDEFPQVWNILKGELSLVGPRNDIAGLGARLAEAIPYYNTRYVVTPGISGWAQINQRYAPGNVSPQSVEETEVRLAYDLYYIKHRSFMLDLIIALKTLRRMFFR